MSDIDGERYYAGSPDEQQLKVFDDIRQKRKGVWIHSGPFLTLESGRRVYTGEVSIHSSDDYSEVLNVRTDDILPCDTLLDGLQYFLTVLNAPGVYAVGSRVLAEKVLGMHLSSYNENALRNYIANRYKNELSYVNSNSVRLKTRTTGVRRRCEGALSMVVIGAHAEMSDVRDMVRNKDLMILSLRVEVRGDSDTLKAIELEPHLSASDRGVLRYVTRKMPPGGYAPNLNKPVTALAYTQSLAGDPAHVLNAMATTMRAACEEELYGMPASVSIGKESCDAHWLYSYARIVMWHRRLKQLPAAMRDPVALLLPGSGHKDRTAVAVAIVNHVMYFAPVIRKRYDGLNRFVLLLAISMLWRILNVPAYAVWRKRHAEVLERSRLPQDAAAKVIAAEFCAYAPRIAGGAKMAVDRLHPDDDYAGLDMTKAKADATAFLLKYAPKGSTVRQS